MQNIFRATIFVSCISDGRHTLASFVLVVISGRSGVMCFVSVLVLNFIISCNKIFRKICVQLNKERECVV